MNKTTINRQVVNEARVLVPTLSVGEATVEQLQERVQSTIPAENQLAGIRAQAIADLRRREGAELTETVLREDGLRFRRRARSEIETAVELQGLVETSEGLRDGEISYDKRADHRGGLETGRDR